MTYPERWLTWCKAGPAYSLTTKLEAAFNILVFHHFDDTKREIDKC